MIILLLSYRHHSREDQGTRLLRPGWEDKIPAAVGGAGRGEEGRRQLGTILLPGQEYSRALNVEQNRSRFKTFVTVRLYYAIVIYCTDLPCIIICNNKLIGT